MSKLHIETVKYDNMFPFSLVIIYKKKGVFHEMIKEAVSEYPELMQCFADDTIESTENALAFVYNRNSSNIFMFITDEVTHDVLVHECTHVTFAAFNILGAGISAESEEFFAYMTEAVYRDVSRIILNMFKLKMKPYYL